MSALGVFAIVGGSMAIKDLFYVAAEFLVSRSKAIFAAVCDILGDIASVVTYGVGGVEVFKHGVSLIGLMVLLGIALGSAIGTTGGLKLGHFLEHVIPEPVKAPTEQERFLADLPDRLRTLESMLGRVVPDLTARIRKLEATPVQLPAPPPTPAPKLTEDDRREFLKADETGRSLFDRQRCPYCGGVHTMACPRVQSESIENGKRSVTFFPWGEWPTENIVWADDLYADTPEGGA